MSSVQHLREFISERLAAAAEEIFSQFEKTIEEELEAQRRLLDISWKTSLTAELPQHRVYEQVGRTCCVDVQEPEPEPPQTENRPVEFWTRQEDKHLLLKKDLDGFLLESSLEEASALSEDVMVQFQDMMAGPVSKQDEVLNSQQLSDHDRKSSLDQLDTGPPSQSKGDKEEPQPSQFKEDQVDPGPLQTKEDQEDLHSSPDQEQLVLKKEGDVFMVTVDCEERDQAEAEQSSLVLSSQKVEGSLDPDGIGPYSCSTCGKSFSDLSSLKFHQQTHQDEKPYSCQTCLKSFGRRDSLLRHMITHTGERRYSCQICGDRFGLNSHLLRHMRTHTGEKPFSCQVCLKSFSQSNSLTDHMRIHTGEKPYSCEECGKRFVQRGALNVHMRTHTGEKPFSCSMCGKGFSASTSLLHHIRTHTGEKPFSCKQCGKRFSQNSNLMSHKRSSHM
nr:zinc finger protein 771 [Nothobranchius furzeri]